MLSAYSCSQNGETRKKERFFRAFENMLPVTSDYICLDMKAFALPYSDRAFFLLPRTGGGRLRRPYPCNSTTAYGMAPKFTQNDILIISFI